MNATEDGVEPVGEAPELTAQSQPEPKHFGQQSVWRAAFETSAKTPVFH